MPTPMYPVYSSQLAYIGYEEETKCLYITFKKHLYNLYNLYKKQEEIRNREIKINGT
jgi:hypothetical protein